MKKLVAIAIASAISTGCVTFRHMEAGLEALVGQPETEAFNVLGYPSFKQEFGNDTVYVWQNTNAGTYFMSQTATTTGRIGFDPVRAKTTYVQPIAYSHTCTVKIITDSSSSRIKRWEYDGNPNGCNSYMRRLKSYGQEVSKPQTMVEAPRAQPQQPVLPPPPTQQKVEQVSTLPSSSPGAANLGKMVTLIPESVPLYIAPASSSARLDRLTRDNRILVKKVSGDWLEVTTESGKTGWVPAASVTPRP